MSYDYSITIIAFTLGSKQNELDVVQEQLSKLQQKMQAEAASAAKQVLQEQTH